ncbi:MAG: glycine cleavage system protein H [Pseudomonadota bacterium]|nr:MAG: glycine cleavage system protein H [Pseudomonadota bacterium]
MGVVRGCDVPEALFYHIDNNVWARRESDGTVTVGVTAYGCALCGPVVSCSPRKPGDAIKRDRSCATLESSKWVGPVKAPVSGELLEVNAVLSDTPGLINQDPYGAGWIARLKPTNWDGDAGELVTGADALGRFETRMDADGFGSA